MRPFKQVFLNHLKCLRQAARAVNGTARMDVDSLAVTVRIGTHTHALYPQFVFKDKGALRCTHIVDDSVQRFVGWRPYLIKNWILAADRLRMKEHLVCSGIATPAYSTHSAEGLGDVVLKHRTPLQGHGVVGPIRGDAAQRPRPDEDEYVEEFVPGQMVKAWFWNAAPVCMEVLGMPQITGDGRRSVAELLEAQLAGLRRTHVAEVAFSRAAECLAFADMTMETVVAKGKSAIVDFRYRSPFLDPNRVQEASLQDTAWSSVSTQLKRVGEALWQSMDDRLLSDSVFVVDAVLDVQGRLWIIDINGNPAVHPHVYGPMLKSLAMRSGKERSGVVH